MRTRLVAAVVVFGLVFGSAAAEAHGPIPDERPGQAESSLGGEVSEAKSAVALAKASGERVEVMGQRTETRQVFARPDGTFMMELSARVERVRSGDGWVAPDTTLRPGSNGTVTPGATVESLAFSGGGSDTPLVRLAKGDRRIELTWPGVLPSPTLRGDTAAYAEVLPGVDLRLTAKVQGFSAVLVVKSRQAASDPRLARIELGLATAGLTVAGEEHGGLTAKDPSGAVVFASPAAQMGDSPVDGSTEQRRAEGRVRLTSGRLTIAPDQRLLKDPSVTYPIVIDPLRVSALNSGLCPAPGPNCEAPNVGWLKVFSGKAEDEYWNGGGDDSLAKVGQCYDREGGCNGIGYSRSYWQFDITGLRGADIQRAEFNLHAVWSPSCQARTFQVWHTNPVGPATNFANQPPQHTWRGPLAEPSGAWGRSACPANWVGVDVKGALEERLTESSSSVTFLVKAADEGDDIAWRKFDTARMIAYYNWPPGIPSDRWANVGQGPSLGCADDPAKAFASSSQLTLHATPIDFDEQNLSAQFEWATWGGPALGSATTAAQPKGNSHATKIPADVFPHGSKVRWRVRAHDGVRWGDWSPYCAVTVDTQAPGRPGLSSADYPDSGFNGYAGKTGAFTATAADPDVIGFQWSMNFQDLPLVDVNSPSFVPAVDGRATIYATPTKEGRNDLYVRAVDSALNVSPMYQKPDGNGGWVPGGYGFLVGSEVPPPVGHWPLDGHYPAAVALDASDRGRHGTVTGLHPASGAAWTGGRVGDALRFDGATGYVGTTGGPAVDTSRTYSVSAWARLDRVGGFPTVVSEDGKQTAAFQVQATSDGRWGFAMFGDDINGGGPRHDRVVSTNPARIGVWTHLVGTYDSGSDQMRLYVNGSLAGSGTHRDAWAASGPLTIGQSMWNGQPSDYWPGAIDDVRVWDRLLTDVEIQRLAGWPAHEEAFYPLDEGQGTAAVDASGNLRNATLANGARWVTGEVGTGALEFDGVDDAATAAGPVVRTDGSFTVTARVRATFDAASRTAVSQDGDRKSGFSLQYRGDTGRWVFAMAEQDNDTADLVKAEGSVVPYEQEWTHLAGVYDQPARQLRLYVNGAQVGTAPYPGEPWHAAGSLAIGRGKLQGQLTSHWLGAVDDVHVYQGVRTITEIRADHRNPVTNRPTLYAGQLSRYADSDGRHYVTSVTPPRNAYLEASLGLLAPEGAAGTRPLYSCWYGGGQFVSVHQDCEGGNHKLLGEIGRVYAGRPSGMPTLEVFRCLVEKSGDHFASNSADCEGHRNEGSLGFTRAYRYLGRFVREHAPRDRLTSTTLTIVPGGYRADRPQGIVAGSWEPGTVSLYSCYDGFDEFLSTDQGCGGQTLRWWIGNIWSQPPAYAQATAQLFSCRVTASGERFASLDETCEGETKLGSFGHVITRL